MPQTMPGVVEDVSDTIRTNYVGFASFVILVWDHALTFSDEVEYIWKGRKGPIIYLFIFNRYFTPLGFIVNLYAYLSPSWTVERSVIRLAGYDNMPSSSTNRCARFIRYEGCTVAIAIEVVGLMMLLRINALYPTQKWITASLAFLLLVETIVNVWLISRGQPVLHNEASGIHACTMVFDPAISSAASVSAWYPLLYDTIVLGLTINRTFPPIRQKQAGIIVKKLLEDGLLYFSVIFAITFVLTFMIIGAPPGTKNICAQMEQLITVAMMSRITLSLKKAGRRNEIVASTSLLSGHHPDFFADTFLQSVDDTQEGPALSDRERALAAKHPDRVILTGRRPIQFAAPPQSPPASTLSEVFELYERAAAASLESPPVSHRKHV